MGRYGGRALIPIGVLAGIVSLLLLAHRVLPGSAGSMLDGARPWLAAPTLLLTAPGSDHRAVLADSG